MDDTRNNDVSFQYFDFEVIADELRSAQLGLITLETDLTIEDELRFFFSGPPTGVYAGGLSLLHSRIPCNDEVTAENLQQMEGHFAASLALFPPGHAFDVIGYGCTSASLLIGAEKLETLVKKQIDVKNFTTPIIAAKRALEKLGAGRIGYLAPYISEISAQMCADFEGDGFAIGVAATFGEGKDSVVGRISPSSIKTALCTLAGSAAGSIDAIFVSCTSLKCASIIQAAEAELGIPVISSNSALAWDMARLANVSFGSSINCTGKGMLFA